MNITTKSCARCGGTHENLEYKPLSDAVDCWKWYTLCPVNGEPILMATREDSDAEADAHADETMIVTLDDLTNAFALWGKNEDPPNPKAALERAKYFATILRSSAIDR